MSLNFISIAGFSASGSSAVVDLLKEYNNVYECDAEIRLIQDPFGIRQLERSLIDDWNYLTSSAAINDFLWMAERCSRTGGGKNPFARCGLSYSKKISPDFMNITKEYVENLSDYSFYGDYYFQKFRKPYIKYVLDRCSLGMDAVLKTTLLSRRVGHKLYFAHPNREQFYEETKNYFEKLFKNYIPDDNGYIILDQAVSVNDTDAISRYFRNGKVIIVDRDPRDMYVDDIVNWGAEFANDMSSRDMGFRYVLKHRAMHDNINYNDNVLYVRFEDLVLHYDDTVSAIENFLGLKSTDHIHPRTFLKPEVSKKNVGIWEKYYDDYKDAVDVIKMELIDYCR